jgi:hypothetical protein
MVISAIAMIVVSIAISRMSRRWGGSAKENCSRGGNRYQQAATDNA